MAKAGSPVVTESKDCRRDEGQRIDFICSMDSRKFSNLRCNESFGAKTVSKDVSAKMLAGTPFPSVICTPSP